MRTIHLPVIEQIEIDDYVLYPGMDSDPGLNHRFLPGVNVIVGINGIGKTTLLSIIFRLFTGPRDLRGGDELGGAQRSLATIRSDMFADRVPDRAKDAIATIRFSLGGRFVELTRSLANLQLLELNFDGTPNETDSTLEIEDQYKRAVCELAGVDDFFDFVLLLQYLSFYLEDRRSLIWDTWAQTEVLRILFAPDDLQKTYKEKLGIALSADSAARNTQHVLTRERTRLLKLLEQEAQSTPDELKLLRVQVKQMEERSKQLAERLSELDETRRARRRDVEQRRHEAERVEQEELRLREQMLEAIFPSLSDYGAFVLASIQAGRGCVVCGTTDQDHLKHVADHLSHSIDCPICGSMPAQQEGHGVAPTLDDRSVQLETLAQERQAQKKAANSAAEEAKQALQDYLKVQAERDELSAELSACRQKLEVKEALVGGGTPEQIIKLDERVRVLQESVDEQLQIKRQALEYLRDLVGGITDGVEEFKDKLIERFDGFVKSFLAERCVLDYRTVLRKIGQGASIQIAFPEFHVLMTSGVFRNSGTSREDISSVSESQKEFIELAFRMTFLSIAAEQGSCSLIIETPEANLDAVFIPKAGAALNDFARGIDPVRSEREAPAGSQKFSRTIIATSNLNGSEMIPALLGNQGGDIDAQSKGDGVDVDRSDYILNLLDYAAKSQALRDYSVEYTEKLDEAIRLSA
ncbi:AAA family ATPase [Burkholderia ambifaria]|uniref:AAA family ATPase n=1 Tax=Burkholderia ambifaria TaxID=152480 RepID=UPI00158962BE|nr:AAA family ATPase [Burkholderia ambifaria]